MISSNGMDLFLVVYVHTTMKCYPKVLRSYKISFFKERKNLIENEIFWWIDFEGCVKYLMRHAR